MNKNRKLSRRTVFTAASCAMLGVAAVGGTLAYLTDSETTTNTFTVGKVTTDLKEPNYPGNGSDEVTNITPNAEVPKDPQVENTGKNNMVAFLKIYSPVSLINVVDDNGANATGLQLQEIFFMKDSAQDESDHHTFTDADATARGADGWVELTNKETASAEQGFYQAYDDNGVTRYRGISAADAAAAIRNARFYRQDPGTEEYIPIDHETALSGEYGVFVKDGNDFTRLADTDAVQANIDAAKIYKAYVFGHDVEVKPNETTDAIFDKVQLKNVIEGEIDTQTQHIVIENYAIQSENIIDEGDYLPTSGTMNQGTLEKIYDKFVNQATAGEGDEAVPGDLQQNVEAHDANVTLNKDLNGDYKDSSTQKITISVSDAKIQVGEQIPASIVTTLNGAPIAPGDNDTGVVKYASSNENVATVDEATGVIEGKALGTAFITATWYDKNDQPVVSAKVEITVVNPELYVMSFNVPKTSLKASAQDVDDSSSDPDKAVTIAAGRDSSSKALDYATRGTITFESSNPEVATVDAASGKVTAVKQGTAVITATWADGTATLAKESVSITVED